MKIMPFLKRQNSVFLTTLIGLILIGILICLPTGYEDALIYQGTERAVGKVVETDNSAIITSGLLADPWKNTKFLRKGIGRCSP